jgi:hypothetical protein
MKPENVDTTTKTFLDILDGKENLQTNEQKN